MKQEININLFEDGKFWNESKLRREITPFNEGRINPETSS